MVNKPIKTNIIVIELYLGVVIGLWFVVRLREREVLLEGTPEPHKYKFGLCFIMVLVVVVVVLHAVVAFVICVLRVGVDAVSHDEQLEKYDLCCLLEELDELFIWSRL
jgi:uncharacterized protein HemY